MGKQRWQPQSITNSSRQAVISGGSAQRSITLVHAGHIVSCPSTHLQPVPKMWSERRHLHQQGGRWWKLSATHPSLQLWLNTDTAGAADTRSDTAAYTLLIDMVQCVSTGLSVGVICSISRSICLLRCCRLSWLCSLFSLLLGYRCGQGRVFVI